MLQYKIQTAKSIKRSARYAAVNYDSPNDPDLKKGEHDLLRYLCLMSGKKGFCWPSINFLCVGLDLDPERNHRNVRRRLKRLEDLGYIQRDARYDCDKNGRQQSNKITINYISGVNAMLDGGVTKFTPPINISLYNLTLKEKINKKEKSLMKTLENAWTYPQVKLVYGWSKGSARGGDFTVMRSKSLLRGLGKEIIKKNTSKWENLLAKNSNLAKASRSTTGERKMSAINDDLDDLFTRPTHKMPAPKIETPAPRADNLESLSVGGVSWSDICVQMNRMGDQFQHWSTRLYMSGLRGSTLEIFAETPYFRDTCQNRFGEDLLIACKKLGYPVKFVNIKLRDK